MRVLGIDYGTVRTGLAISDELGIVVTPYVVLPYSPDLVDRIADIVSHEGIQRIVVGMPYEAEGVESEMMLTVRAFITQLRSAVPCPVDEWDESFSSRNAVARMVEAGVRKKRRRERSTTDAWAAAIILQEYLDASG